MRGTGELRGLMSVTVSPADGRDPGLCKGRT